MHVQKVEHWDAVQDYDSVTLLTEFGKFLPESKIYRIFKPYFFTATINYFNIKKSIIDAGYLESDLYLESCAKTFEDNNTFLLDQDFSQKALWKS